MDDPYITLEIPVQEDEEHIRAIIETAYNQVKNPYERLENPPEWIMRRGSLCQELLAQINDQTRD